MEIEKVDPEIAKECVKRVMSGAACLIDVRGDEEWSAGHASKAIHFELPKLENGEMPNLPRDSEIYVYCAAGGRAQTAKSILTEKGFTNVRNLGGLKDWITAGGDVLK